jgi:replication-associated recombination protein RarA
MKELSLIKTRNVKEADKLIDYLLNRPKTEMVGLGLIYGPPGLGKSRFAKQKAIMEDYIYLRLEATMTAKSFAIKLLEVIRYHLGMSQVKIRGTANEIFNRTLNILKNYDNIVIIIDEIDYAFRSQKILGSIRDIVDETLSVVILVGMTDAKEKLLLADSHYFDRCNYFCEFKEITESDIKSICSQISDVKIEDSIIRIIKQKTKGNIRKLIKALYSIETNAKNNNLSVFGIEQLKSLEIM